MINLEALALELNKNVDINAVCGECDYAGEYIDIFICPKLEGCVQLNYSKNEVVEIDKIVNSVFSRIEAVKAASKEMSELNEFGE